jgi:hypothetical protein
VGISLARQALDHGDYVVSGIIQAEFESDQGRSQEFKSFLAEVGRSNGWKERLKIVALDIRYVSMLWFSRNGDTMLAHMCPTQKL